MTAHARRAIGAVRVRAAIVAMLVGAITVAPSAQGSSWLSWIRSNHHPIASVETRANDDFADLQFLKATLEGRRIVQLGESGHGVAQFNSVKVRLIKFLHEQMGYDVIAFESAIFESFIANTSSKPAANMLADSIFAVWATEEVRPLFEYIQETQKTDRPLILAGFDSQISSYLGVRERPAFFRRIVRAIDPVYADEVFAADSEIVDRIRTGTAYVKAEEARLADVYSRLEAFLAANASRLREAFPGDPSPQIAHRAAWSMVRFVRQLVASVDRPNDASLDGSTSIRDRAMAENLTFLARELYPDRKIITWAHNFHIRHQNAKTVSAVATMGSWVKQEFPTELYTIGLYMDQGTAAWNNRTIYSILPATAGSVEFVLANAGSPVVFVDLARQDQQPGNSWMFQNTPQREWGQNPFPMIVRDQYDGIILVEHVTPPTYLRF